MNYSQTLEQMRSLRLHGMAEALDNLIAAKKVSTLSGEQLLAVLVQQEHDERHGRKIDRLKKAAKFRYNAALDQIRADASRNLDAALLAQLSTCSWINNNENILITGPAGVGKSNLASALGHQSCLNGFKALYFNTQKLFYSLRLGKMDGTHRKQINAIAKADVLIIDDFGLQKLDDYSRLDLMEVMEDRHGRKSTIISSQLPVPAWYDIIAEPTLSDAILDRLTSKSIRIELKGESLRKKK
jgi:DNA replication protein DnaC